MTGFAQQPSAYLRTAALPAAKGAKTNALVSIKTRQLTGQTRHPRYAGSLGGAAKSIHCLVASAEAGSSAAAGFTLVLPRSVLGNGRNLGHRS